MDSDSDNGNEDAMRELHQRIHTAVAPDGRRLLTLNAVGPQLHILDHRFESVLTLTSPNSQSTSSSSHHAPDIASVRALHAHIDDDHRFLVAAAPTSSSDIHFWQEPRSSSLFQTKGRTWRQHSILTLLPDAPDAKPETITTFDLAVRKLPIPRDEPLRLQNLRNSNSRDAQPRTQVLALVGSTASLSLWSLSEVGAPSWKREWTRRTPARIVCATLIQDASLAAAFVENDTRAMIWSITAPHVGGSSGFRTPSRASGTTSAAESLHSPETSQQGAGAGEEKSKDRPVVRLIDRLQHSRALVSIEWRKPAEGPSARSDPLLITHTTDGTARIWATVIDQPLQFRLWSSVLANPSIPTRSITRRGATSDRKGKMPERVFYLGAQEITMAFRAHIWELEKEHMRAELGVEDFDLPEYNSSVAAGVEVPKDANGSDPDAVAKKRKKDRERDMRRTRLQRLQQIVSETPDMFLTHLEDGTLRITAVANIDRSPPTLFQSMTISHVLRLPRSSASAIVSARFIPMLTAPSIATLSPREDGASRSTGELLLVTDRGTELRYAVIPGLLFDGSPLGLKLKSVGRERRRRKGAVGEDVSNDTILPLYHPRMLRLAILSGNLSLARLAVIQLSERIRATDPEDMVEVPHFPPEAQAFATIRKSDAKQISTAEATDGSELVRLEEAREDIAEHGVGRRIEGLEEGQVAEILQLTEIIQNVEDQQKGLDYCGARFVAALKEAVTFSQLEPSTKSSTNKKKRSVRLCLSGSDAAWAAHSPHQAKLVQKVQDIHDGRLSWSAASGTSLFLWLRGPPETIRQHAESLARAQYTGGPEDEDQHDPTRCSMLYYALGKHKLVLNLWRQASWHPDSQKMVQFLQNDFSSPRWRTAALKNAFALMSKRKFELAGAFFMLGDSLKDAANVCVRNLEDVGLAVAVARIAEGRDDGPVLKGVLGGKLLPLALERGDRGLASLALGLLGERELESEVLVVRSLVDFVGRNAALRSVLGEAVIPTLQVHAGGNDLSALLLYNHLQTRPDHLRGNGDCEGEARKAVLEHAGELRRQGCDIFALRLVLDWNFPSAPKPTPAAAAGEGLSSIIEKTDGRRDIDDVGASSKAVGTKKFRVPPPAVAASDELSSSLWDSFDGPSPSAPVASASAPAPAPAPAAASVPPPTQTLESKAAAKEEEPKPAAKKKTGLGTLMKPTSATQPEQGGTEFDMSAFGF
ncbi:unnamed protein product [Tilletia controversa]|nr:unnamed protein product [Tilletia controversa]